MNRDPVQGWALPLTPALWSAAFSQGSPCPEACAGHPGEQLLQKELRDNSVTLDGSKAVTAAGVADPRAWERDKAPGHKDTGSGCTGGGGCPPQPRSNSPLGLPLPWWVSSFLSLPSAGTGTEAEFAVNGKENEVPSTQTTRNSSVSPQTNVSCAQQERDRFVE